MRKFYESEREKIVTADIYSVIRLNRLNRIIFGYTSTCAESNSRNSMDLKTLEIVLTELIIRDVFTSLDMKEICQFFKFGHPFNT
ncbi:hypothetical protein BpHYR1_029888 [Brachionus plicatilis]|uniref:Uncharacterized protein n=1 Tax=Brachionus plicatilis TaxID=10195 RepID=A0A3M7PEE6_BRAPC|nr:hypothetical protein BpHYR1_029888 [Brachionus plicatilis]